MVAFDHLNKLFPFIDDQNLVQLRGKIRHAEMSNDMNYLNFLSAKHPRVK